MKMGKLSSPWCLALDSSKGSHRTTRISCCTSTVKKEVSEVVFCSRSEQGGQYALNSKHFATVCHNLLLILQVANNGGVAP
jgi:hypothetical protein